MHAADDDASLVPELEQLLREMDAIDAQFRSVCSELGETELAWRPAPQKWSIAENLVHLRLTTETFLPAADQAIEEARRQELVSRGPFRLGRLDRIFVWYVEPPPKIRAPAPKPLQPLVSEAVSGALTQFIASQKAMRRRLKAADGLHLTKARVTSPLARFIRMSLLGFFSVFIGHERRHLQQASRVRQQLSSSSFSDGRQLRCRGG